MGLPRNKSALSTLPPDCKSGDGGLDVTIQPEQSVEDKELQLSINLQLRFISI